MLTKLKLEINLSNTMDVDDSGKLTEEYKLYIRVLNKDERFDTSGQPDNVLVYNGTGVFTIKSVWDENGGGIIHNGLLIPSTNKLGYLLKKTFKDDMDRYLYLKNLYVAIEEWANYWWGFRYDDKSKLTVKDNIWEVTCDTVYTGSLRYLKENLY